MSDFSKSRSNYLKIMNGDINKRVASVTSNPINQVNDTSYDSVELSSYQNQANTTNAINQAKNTISDMSTPEENKERSWWQKIYDTGKDLSYSFTESLFNFFDDVVDFLVFDTSKAIGDAFGADTTWAVNARDYDWVAQASKITSMTLGDVWTGDMFKADYWSMDPEDIRADMEQKYNASYLNALGTKGHDFIRGAVGTIGYMVPSIVMGNVGGAVGNGAKIIGSLDTAQAFSLGTMGLGAFSSTADEAYQESGNIGKAIGAGFLSAGVEIGSELFVGKGLEALGLGTGKVMGVFGADASKLSTGGKSVVKELIKGMNEEGIEEVFSGLFDPIVKSIYQGKDAFKNDKGELVYFDKDFWIGGDDSIVSQYIMGATVGGIFGGVSEVGLKQTYGKDYSKALKLLDSNLELRQEINNETDATKKTKLEEQYATNALAIASLVKQGQTNASKAQQANFLQALSNPAEIANIKAEDTNKFLDERISELNNKDRIETRNLFNELENKYGTGYTLKFGDVENNGYGKIDHKTKTITLNQEYASKHAGTLVHEYFGHAIGNGLTENQINSMFSKVIKTKWYETNGKELRDNYKGDKFKQEVVNKYMEGVFDTHEKANDVFMRNTILTRLNSFFNKKSNLNILKNNAIASEFIKSLDKLLKVTKSTALQSAMAKLSEGKKLTKTEKELIAQYGAILEASNVAEIEYSINEEQSRGIGSLENASDSLDSLTKLKEFNDRNANAIVTKAKALNFAYNKVFEQNELQGLKIESFKKLKKTKDLKFRIEGAYSNTLKGHPDLIKNLENFKTKFDNPNNIDLSMVDTAIDELKSIKDAYQLITTQEFKDRLQQLNDGTLKKETKKVENEEKTKTKVDNLNEQVENENKEGGRSNEFRRLQEESRKLSSKISQQERVNSFDDSLRDRVEGILSREVGDFYSRDNDTSRLLENTPNFKIHENVDGQLFHDVFEVAKTYLPNGELVDLHDNYDDCNCYLSEDGLSGFAIEKNGNLVSVFNLNRKKGFLREIAPIIKERATHLDCYVSNKQNLQGMYEAKFGFKTASIMDYNMEYDHDDIAKNHDSPQVAFMVNTTNEVETKHFNKDQYNDAYNYQQEALNSNSNINNTNQNQENNELTKRSDIELRGVKEGDADLVGNKSKPFNSEIKEENLKPFETNKGTEIKEGTQDKLGKVINIKSVQDVYDYVEQKISEALGHDFKIKDKEGKARRLFEEYNIGANNAQIENIEKFANDMLLQNVNSDITVDGAKSIVYTLEEYLTSKNIDSKDFVKQMSAVMYELLNDKAVTTKTQKKIDKLLNLLARISTAKAELQASNKLARKLNTIKNNLAKKFENFVGKTGQLPLTAGIAKMYKSFFSKVDYTSAGYASNSNMRNLKEMVDNGSLDAMVKSILNPNNELGDIPDLSHQADTIMTLATDLASEYNETQQHMTYDQITRFTDLNKAIYKLYRDFNTAVKENARTQAQTIVNEAKIVAEHKKANNIKNSILTKLFDAMSPRQFFGYVFGGTDTKAFKTVYEDLYAKGYEEQIGKYVDFLELRDKYIDNIKKERYKKIKIGDVKVNKYTLYQFYLNTLSPENDARMRNGGLTYTDKTSAKLSYEEVEKVMNENLTKEEKADLDNLFKLYNNELKTYVEDISERNLGFRTSRDNYYPIVASDAFKLKDFSNPASMRFNVNAMENGRLKSLKNSKTVIELNVDPIRLYADYVESMTITGEIGLKSQKLNRLFQLRVANGESLRSVISAYTPNATTYISYAMNQLLGNVDNISRSGLLDRMVGKYATATLGLNIRSMMKQLASLFTAWSKVGLVNGVKSMLSPEMYQSIWKNRAKLVNNNVFRLRIYENGVVRGTTLSAGAGQFASETLNKINDFTLKGMEMLDRMTCYLTYGMAEATVKRAYPNESQDFIDAKTNEIFTNMILDTQSNADRIAMSRIRSGALGKVAKNLFGMFASDAQNKAGLAFESWNNWNEARKQGDKERTKKAGAQMGTFLAGALASGMLVVLADMLADWWYDKEDPEDFDIVDKLVQLLGNTFTDWVPYLNSMINWFKYDGASIGALENMNELIETLKNFMDGKITKKEVTNAFMQVGKLMGIPLGNLEKHINGILGNFSPELAFKYKNLLYGVSQNYLSTQSSEYIKSGKTSKAKAVLSLNYQLYKFTTDDEVASEIVNVKKDGGAISMKNVPDTVGEVTLTQEQKKEFAQVYSQANESIKKLIQDSNYQQLDAVGKAKAMNKIADAYYDVAKKQVLGITDISKIGKILNSINKTFDYQKIVAAMILANTKEDIVKGMNSTKGLTRVEKLLALRLLNRSITSENKESVNRYLKSLGMKTKEIEELWV